VRQTWKVSRLGVIAGCMVVNGVVKRTSKVRISRGGIVIHDGTMGSLKRFKDDAKEVLEGFDCGIMVDRFDNIEPGDTIEAYEIESIKRTFDG
jgi:translation initiation factor IF-2